jgi:type I restriction enzyme S subunit
MSSDCVKLKPHSSINVNYLNYCINSTIIRKQCIDNSSGTTRKRTSLNKLREILIPIPPLAEQERIVEKLDELMANCDQLEVKAEEMKKYTAKLFEASLKEAFMPE